MALKYGFSIRGIFASIFRLFMEFPTDVPGLFDTGQTRNTVASWRSLLSTSDFPPQCPLIRMVLYKATTDKEHEFVLFYFHHWKLAEPATAVLVVDRTVDLDSLESAENNGSAAHVTRSSGIISPSASQIPAHDSVVTMQNKTSIVSAFLKHRYGSYNQLLTLEFPATSAPPSATEISVLLSAIAQHAPNYHLYQTQCFWFASTIWEAVKQLFPDCHETTQNDGRSRYLGLKVGVTDSVNDVCREYRSEWTHIQNEAEQKMQAECDRAQRLRDEGRDEGRAEGWAEAQVIIDQLRAQLTLSQSLSPSE